MLLLNNNISRPGSLIVEIAIYVNQTGNITNIRDLLAQIITSGYMGNMAVVSTFFHSSIGGRGRFFSINTYVHICLCNSELLKPHYYIVKLVFIGVLIIRNISALNFSYVKLQYIAYECLQFVMMTCCPLHQR